MKLPENNSGNPGRRRFEFERDSFAFANELLWAYDTDPQTGRTQFRPRQPKPAYTHRCFVLTRAARQFLYHAQFAPHQDPVDETAYRSLIRQVIARNPRLPCPPENQIIIPGHGNLREFSARHAHLLKAECGAAWQSYVLRSHWRMIFPISRAHQARTAASLTAELERSGSPIVQLVKFPSLAINHGMILYAVTARPTALVFKAYDPNEPRAPVELTFDRRSQTFYLPPNAYWPGGELNIIEIFRSWLM